MMQRRFQTPAAVAEFSNVASAVFIDVPAGCCITVSVKNISEQAIDVQNANLIIERVA
jgi:inorganic pyrophosphatase/exopolyphosphatase